MNIHHCVFATLLTAGLAHANPFPDANIEAGGGIHADQCVACHAAKFGGTDGSDIYTRSNRRVTTPGALTQQLTACTTMLNLGLFPEDELDIAGYLNKMYYKFE